MRCAMTLLRSRGCPNAVRSLCATVLLVPWALGCTEAPTVTPDAARKDAAAEVADLGDDVGKDPGEDAVAKDAVHEDATEKPKPDAGSSDPSLPEDIPATYDVQLDRSWDALPVGLLIPADATALLADRVSPTPPGIPCTVGAIEACACIDGREGWQACEHTRVFSACSCATPAVPPFPLPPRLVHPLSGMRVTSQRPTLRWVLPEGVTRARVELCADRPCTQMIAQQEVAGTAWRPASRLAPGVVFWRVRGLDASGAAVWTSATWLFRVGARDAAADTAYGRIRDFNGDGYDDVVVPQVRFGELAAEMHVFFGSARGIGPVPELVLRSPSTVPTRAWTGRHLQADLTGDGLADLLVAEGPTGPGLTWGGAAYLYEGHREHPLARRIARLDFRDRPVPRLLAVDYDADGLLDLFLPNIFFRGSTEGPVEAPQMAFSDAAYGTCGDVDGDGYVEYVDLMGTRRAYGRFPLLPHEAWPLPPEPAYTVGCNLAPGDMDGDRRADLLTWCWASTDPTRISYGNVFPTYSRGGHRPWGLPAPPVPTVG